MTQADRALFMRIFQSYRPYMVIFIFGVVMTLMMSGVDSIFPWGIKVLIDKGITHPDPHYIRWMPFAVIFLSLVRSGGSVGSRYFMMRVVNSVVRDYRRALFSKLLKLPASFYDHRSTGHILSTLLYNTDQIVQAGIDVLVNALQDGSAAIGLLGMMCFASWRLFLLTLIFAPPMVIMTSWANRRMRKVSKHIQQGMGDVTHVAEEGIKNYRMIRIYGGQAYEQEKFHYFTEKNLKRQLKVAIISSLSAGSMQIFIAVPLVVVFYLFQSLLFSVTAGSLIAFITALVMLVKPLRRLVNLNSQIQKGFSGAEGVFEILDVDCEQDVGAVRVETVKGHIQFKNVCFQYTNSKDKALHHVNFSIQPRQTVALVGRSGSGKTTIASLLPRFYDVHSGEILIDGVDVQHYVLADLRAQFSLVSQNITLFNDTIARNIAYGDVMDRTEAEIIAAAEAAHAMDFIRDLPKGIHTIVGENGVLLSGGQRQRIAIARAILKCAPILILDEATSALDTETERAIQMGLNHLMAGCTSLVIAHRLSTIENADWILVMDSGHIVEQGTHQDLLQINRIYAGLYRTQFNESLHLTAEVASLETEIVDS